MPKPALARARLLISYCGVSGLTPAGGHCTVRPNRLDGPALLFTSMVARPCRRVPDAKRPGDAGRDEVQRLEREIAESGLGRLVVPEGASDAPQRPRHHCLKSISESTV
jgi:hypothetical protein